MKRAIFGLLHLLVIFSLALTGCASRAEPAPTATPLVVIMPSGTTPSATQAPATPTRPSPTQFAPGPTPTVEIPAGALRLDYAAPGTPAPDLYGSNSLWTDQDAAIWKARHAELGVRVMRVPVPQGIFEPQNDDSNPTTARAQGFLFRTPIPWEGRSLTLATWLTALKEQNVTLMLHVPYLAGWLSRNPKGATNSPYPPNDLAEYEEYIRVLLDFVISDVGYDPAMVLLEPVNEPDLGCGQDAAVSCFWQDWQESDLLDVLRAADRAAASVDARIRLVGLSECCGTRWTEKIASNPDTQDLLDVLSYHKYVGGVDLEDMLARGQALQSWGKPVVINEYGSTQFWSDGLPGALWHATALPQLFAAGIHPLQYPIAHFPGMHAGYNNLGLFQDWNRDFEIKPAYWVYAHFYRLLGGGQILAYAERGGSILLVVKNQIDGEPYIAVWVTSSGAAEPQPVTLVFENFPTQDALMSILSNFSAGAPVGVTPLSGTVLRFDFQPLPDDSYTLLLTQPGSSIPDLFHPSP